MTTNSDMKSDTGHSLSPGQEQLWFLAQLHPDDSTYNLSETFRLRGLLREEQLRAALVDLLNRHMLLRVRMVVVDGRPKQTIEPPVSQVALEVDDLSGWREEERQAELFSRLRAAIKRPFLLEGGRLYRFLLFCLGPDEWAVTFVFHHIISDGWSAQMFLSELGVLYSAHIAGVEPVLSEPSADFLERVAEDAAVKTGPAHKRALDFWEHKLRGLPTLELPFDRARPEISSRRGGVVSRTFAPSTFRQVAPLARSQGVSVFTLLVTVLNIVMSKYSGQDDVPLGLTLLGRRPDELDSAFGFYVNMAVLRSSLAGDPSFDGLLDSVSIALAEIYEYGSAPFDEVVDRLQPVRHAGRNPLFQVAVQLLGDGTTGGGLRLAGAECERVDIAADCSRFDISVSFTISTERLGVSIEYSEDVFDRWRVEAMTEHLEAVLDSVIADPCAPMSKIQLVRGAARRRILAAGTGDPLALTDEPLHVSVARRAAEAPSRVAAVCQNVEMTYKQLVDSAESLAERLWELGVKHEQVVGIAMDRGLDTIVAMLGVLRAGAAFTIIDLSYPVERLSHMLRDTAAPVVITRSKDVARVPMGTLPVLLCMDDLPDSQIQSPEDRVLDRDSAERVCNADSLAYVLYTSGSTGRPKGVMIEHRALRAFIEAFWVAFPFTVDDRFLQQPSLTFDASIGEIFTALVNGATLVLPAPDEETPDALAQLLRERKATYLGGMAPARLSMIEPAPYPDLKYVMGGAEALPAHLVNKWNLPGRLFLNLYGPTECAVACAGHICDADLVASPPIGRPDPGRRLYVVDKSGNLVPCGVHGELLIGGDDGLARGYLNAPELTATKFTKDPFRPNGRVYHSGDLVFWNTKMQLEFVGRVDRQIKLRGLRVELGEVEEVILSHPDVALGCVMVTKDAEGEDQLVAYVTSLNGRTVRRGSLRKHLARQLPGYMIPAAWVMLDTFPLNLAGKIDRASLPAASQSDVVDAHRPFAALESSTERLVADIFTDVLSVPRVGAADTFFDLGGNSMQAIRAVHRLTSALGLRVNVRILYGAATVRDVAATIDRLRG